MKKFGLGVALAAGLGALVAGEAVAADLSESYKAAYKAPVEAPLSPWMIRVRALGVLPTDGGSVNGIMGSDLNYSNSITPELDISYFFTENFAAELILGTTKSNVYGAGTINGLGKIGSTWILPPTLTLQYHFTNFGAFKPYIGAGVNYTIFYSQSADLPTTDLSVKNAWGFALQAGFDYMFDRHWGINVDVKKIFLEPSFDATVSGVGAVSGSADLNPWLIGAGVTYRF
ncbi:MULTISPECIES: OmpW/AlkL family protein [unclassified Xanthobacter]|uniref:OmpW/AlkL family protein n=1 Tax=unclassified Xanthobacter TaxID=2623496 RepID=UPI001EDEF846|nr:MULTISPECIES: OmpW family protein [unclassified Xanthobacter]